MTTYLRSMSAGDLRLCRGIVPHLAPSVMQGGLNTSKGEGEAADIAGETHRMSNSAPMIMAVSRTFRHLSASRHCDISCVLIGTTGQGHLEGVPSIQDAQEAKFVGRATRGSPELVLEAPGFPPETEGLL